MKLLRSMREFLGELWVHTKPLRTNWIAFSVVIVAGVAMAEIDRMIEQCVTAASERYSMAMATGLFPQPNAWFGWSTNPECAATLIQFHAAWDVAFALGYCLLGYRLFEHLRWHRSARGWLVLAGVELGESAAEIWIAAILAPDARALTVLVPIVAILGWAKWLILLTLLGSMVSSRRRRKAVGAAFTEWFRAFLPHRAVLIGVVAIGVFALVPRPNLFDQYPDLVRAIVTPHGLDARVVLDTFVAFGYFAVIAAYLGRRATAARTRVEERDKPTYVWWFFAPLIIAVLVVVTLVRGSASDVDWHRVSIVTGVLLLPVLLSIVWNWCKPEGPKNATVQRTSSTHEYDESSLRRMLRAGDLVAGLVILVLGAGLVRAFASPIALRYTGVDTSAQVGMNGVVDLPMTLLVIGVWMPILLPKLLAPRARKILDPITGMDEVSGSAADGSDTTTNSGADPLGDEVPASKRKAMERKYSATQRTVAILIATVCALWWMLWPVSWADDVGPVVTITTLILFLVIIAWNLQAGARLHRPIRIFARFGLDRDPVIPVLVIVALVSVNVPAGPAQHPIQVAGDEIGERKSLRAAFATWKQGNVCNIEIPLDRGTGRPATEAAYLRPLLLIAAEGGGIRAAAWTTRVIDQLSGVGDCAGAAFLSSGVSGGAVGLTLARVPEGSADDEASTPRFELASQLAVGEPLAVVMTGLLLGDTIAAVTGVRAPTDGYRDEQGGQIWQDRAAHLQHAWIGQVEELEASFGTERDDAIGWVVLNSSAVGYGCRVTVSQLDLGLSTQRAEDPRDGTPIPICSGSDPGVANAIDFHELLGKCSSRMDWSTAALLSARFPIVSPAGRTGGRAGEGCDEVPDIQLADGGIVDNSGLATIADLMPEVMERVSYANAAIVRPTEQRPWIVPIVVYVSNSSGGDIAPSAISALTDVTIARDGQAQANAAQNADAAWLQRIAAGISGACAEPLCARTIRAVQDRLGGGVVVVAPRSGPTIAAPLGWALSEMSLRAIDEEVEELSADTALWPSCYAGLGNLLGLLTVEGYTPTPADREPCLARSE